MSSHFPLQHTTFFLSKLDLENGTLVSLIQNVEKTSQLNLHHYLSQRRFQSLCYVHAFLPLTED